MKCIVYKYRLWEPTLGKNLVDAAFAKGPGYYNELVSIENHRRAEYRKARTVAVPGLAELESSYQAVQAKLSEAYAAIRASKQITRSRSVPPELAAQVASLKDLAKVGADAIKKKISQAASDPTISTVLKERAEAIDAEADAAVKALRKTLYWGTYLLVEDAVKRAKKAEPGWLDYKGGPERLMRGRIGIQIQGGIGVADLATDTRIQAEMPERGKGKFRLRVGTVEGSREPVWAEFPAKFHRPLPSDAVIKWAVVTRQPGHLRRPWTYHLCLTLQTNQYEQVLPTTKQEGKTAINFGWRQTAGTLRVATLSNTVRGPEHVLLPQEIYRRFDKCSDLQSLIDQQLDVIKRELGTWIAANKETLPQAFCDTFAGLATWRSAYRLADLVRYWKDHRLPGDELVFPVAWTWRGRWWHLQEWCTCNRQKAIRARRDFYLCLAKQVATTSAEVVIDDTDLSDIAESEDDDVVATGGRKADANRTRAAVSELRQAIVLAAAKYCCRLEVVKAKNNTRKCNVCGQVLEWDPATHLVRECPECSTWDQDVNNTDNLHDLAEAGRSVVMVEPAKKEDSEVVPAVVTTFADARESLR